MMKAYLLALNESRSMKATLRMFILTMMLAVVTLNALPVSAQARPGKQSAAAVPTKSLTLHTEANAIVWLDEVRRGVTDATGQLKLEKITAGRHTLRVRASGFKERVQALAPTQRGSLDIKLVPTTDEAELLFQKAEEAREKAQDEESRQAAVELYRQALSKRPRFPAARIGLARLLLDLNKFNAAFDEIDRARDVRPVYPEASVVEGRILRKDSDNDAAMAAFRRAIREAHGFQPEAHTGLALIYEELNRNDEAVAEFRTALAQYSDSEPVIYQLLGALYEKLEKYKEAVEAYEKYLQLAPDGSLAPAIRSVIDQLRHQAAEPLMPGGF
jgi:tetratricopeptide (TPR) repeat protein